MSWVDKRFKRLWTKDIMRVVRRPKVLQVKAFLFLSLPPLLPTPADPPFPSPGMTEPQHHLHFTHPPKSSHVQMTLYLPPPPGASLLFPPSSPSTSTPSFSGGSPLHLSGDAGQGLLEAGDREGSRAPGQSVLPAGTSPLCHPTCSINCSSGGRLRQGKK